jgi:hypothetical protein
MSRRYLLSVIGPVDALTRAIEECARRPVPERARYIEHQYTIECDAPLAWVRQHADEIAARLVPSYTALNVKEGGQ